MPLWLLDIHFINVRGRKYKRKFNEIWRALDVKPDVSKVKSRYQNRTLSHIGLLVALVVLILALVFGLSPLISQLDSTPESTFKLTKEVALEPALIPTEEVALKPNPVEITTPTFSCEDAPLTRVQVGDIARVTYTDGTSTRLRSEPQAGDNLVENLPEGTEFDIIGGPECTLRHGRDDSYVYWEVSVPSRSLVGWVAEGDFNHYYIEPLSTKIIDVFGIEMNLVPAGEFTMGSDEGGSDEQPVHQVYLDTFYMDKYEITNAQYKVCVDAAYCLPLTNNSSATRKSYYNNSEYDHYPVIYVDWNMAQSYCNWRGVGLPTEAEWEKAARGNSHITYPWGEVANCDRANFGGCIGDTSEVGAFDGGQSIYGVYDMAGNVLEWVADFYSPSYYQESYTPNPQGPVTGKYKVLRGGAWNDYDNEVRSTNHFIDEQSSLNHFVGFRCAKDVTP